MKYLLHVLFFGLTFLVFTQIVTLQEKTSTIPEAKSENLSLKSVFAEKEAKRRAGFAKMDAPDMHAKIKRQLKTPIGFDQPQYAENYISNEYRKAKAKSNLAYSRDDLDFVSRGPGNIAGRTRAIIVDPRDTKHETWIAGSASGGIWKTSDAGKNWRNVSSDLTSLSTNTLAFSPNNADVIYAGTGEHFVDDADGNGMWKSIDAGESWFQIADPETYPGFKNVSRIIVDPNDENVVIASTSNGSWVENSDYGIWKTTDGGISWNKVYTSTLGRVDDLNANPKNFNVIYAAVQGFGVLKSTDIGENWVSSKAGLSPTGRVEIDVSPVDTNRVWASAEGGVTGTGSDLYLSTNGGESWALLADINDNVNYLGGQGWYDHIVTAHPYNEDEVYVGGVNLFKFAFLGGEASESTVIDVDRSETSDFIDFVAANGFSNGILDVSGPQEDAFDVEIRFGEGSQLAYRFTVNMQGAGVPASGYIYQDFVEVPFQVWDVESNRQLNVSFRDQQEDGTWNLIENETSGSGVDDSREYLIIHDLEYSEEINPNIALNGGHEFEEQYFLWPYLVSGATFDPENLPVSSLNINKTKLTSFSSAYVNISDAYGGFSGNNNFSTSNFINQEGVHPDQHNIVIVREDEANETFKLLVTNDGGVYVTDESDDPGVQDGSFNYGGFGYNTSQFYGADKAPGEHRYIGGTQDNSTFFTPLGVEADSSTRYEYAIGGDGFESLWNNSNPNQLIGGSQFNNFARSLDNGATWIDATNGYTETGSPFISRLANSKRFPNRIFTVGASGVWRSNNFGGFWESIPINDMWSFNSSCDIKVSQADSSVIWAGGFLSENSRVFVSQDGGDNFAPVQNYVGEELGFVSGIGTHPDDPGTAYLLFSFAGKAKVIRTEDFGKSWIDISGFEGNGGVSDRGFPDVAITSILVFPGNSDRIWVGSEIGIIESLDGGSTWALMVSNMPPVYVHQFKIQDDQVVLATYGRGIWSVQVDGIERNYVFAPAISDAGLLLNGDLDIDIYFSNAFDSSHIIVNNEVVGLIGPNEKGSSNEVVSGIEFNGETTIVIRSFLEDDSFTSNVFTLNLVSPGAVITQYDNDFSDSGRIGEFVGDGFTVKLETGFEDEAIHSGHNHLNNVNYTYTLNNPYVLTEESPNELQYRDVAIIESGEPGTVFGDDEFWDYVIVEATKDGKTWTPLGPGYDARLFPAWLSAYNSNSVGNSNMYEYQKYDLDDQYDIGDTILVRFRLFADPAVTAWGWAIDDVQIGEVTSGIFTPEFTNVTEVFPNPVSNIINLNTQVNLGDPMLNVFDIDGKLLISKRLPNASSNISLDISTLRTGTYFMTIRGGTVNETHKIIKI